MLQKDILKFIKKALILLLVVFVVDLAVGKVIGHYYFLQHSGALYRTTYAIENTEADIIVFGSSRANHHYRPDIFEQQLKLEFYNTGREGNSVLYAYAVLKGIIKRHTPKIVILDMVYNGFAAGQGNYDRLSSLLPYYHRHPEIQDIIELRSKFEKYKLFSRLYPYNSIIFTILVGNLEMNKDRKSDIKGYLPLQATLQEKITTSDPAESEYELDKDMIRHYTKFIEDCKRSGIQVFIVCSPYYIVKTKPDKSIIKAQSIAEEYHVPFLDFSQDKTFSESSYFADPTHLNDLGAGTFSSLIADRIQEYYLNPGSTKPQSNNNQ